MPTLQIVLNVVLVILVIAVIILAILYFMGNKLQKRQVEQQALIDAAAQTVSLLVIDKKKMKITQAGLPKMVVDHSNVIKRKKTTRSQHGQIRSCRGRRWRHLRKRQLLFLLALQQFTDFSIYNLLVNEF